MEHRGGLAQHPRRRQHRYRPRPQAGQGNRRPRMTQAASRILMVRPAAFSFNAETAVNNHFQQNPGTGSGLQQQALREFDAMVATLSAAGIEVFVVPDTPEPAKPDAVFPNNWISTTSDGRIHLYPMFAPNRRTERRPGIVSLLQQTFRVDRVNDWSYFEEQGHFLEGTGSIIFDHPARTAYAARSPRTDVGVLKLVCAAYGYQSIAFDARDAAGRAIYHTNVLLSIGEGFAVGCGDAIADEEERRSVRESLEASGHEWIDIGFEEMNAFAANLLQVRNRAGEACIVISQAAVDALAPAKLQALERYGRLLPVSVPTIEKVNGGSVRCMMCELFLEPRA
ncbi:MAG: amidinotransferase [Chitinophagaceae bacterium]|nr:MAG: amidinotransferase [Chitinophagaceae bacterium]